MRRQAALVIPVVARLAGSAGGDEENACVRKRLDGTRLDDFHRALELCEERLAPRTIWEHLALPRVARTDRMLRDFIERTSADVLASLGSG